MPCGLKISTSRFRRSAHRACSARRELIHVGALEGLVLDAQLAAEGPLTAVGGGVRPRRRSDPTLSTNDHPPFAVTLKTCGSR